MIFNMIKALWLPSTKKHALFQQQINESLLWNSFSIHSFWWLSQPSSSNSFSSIFCRMGFILATHRVIVKYWCHIRGLCHFSMRRVGRWCLESGSMLQSEWLSYDWVASIAWDLLCIYTSSSSKCHLVFASWNTWALAYITRRGLPQGSHCYFSYGRFLVLFTRSSQCAYLALALYVAENRYISHFCGTSFIWWWHTLTIQAFAAHTWSLLSSTNFG